MAFVAPDEIFRRNGQVGIEDHENVARGLREPVADRIGFADTGLGEEI